MAHLHDLMDPDLLRACIDERYVSERRHPTLPLTILNYTAKAQYEWRWDDVTRQCRGLIVHDDGTVIARPLEKFFSIDQLRAAEITLPDGPFEAYEKLDGSLGIFYCYDGIWYVASRGSFESEQAQRGTQILRRYEQRSPGGKLTGLSPPYTYLVEIIFPENRIVVDYGEREDLVLLTAMRTETGEECYDEACYVAWQHGFPLAEKYDFASVDDLVSSLEDDPCFSGREGFVLRYASGLRVKVKSAEYLHYHRLVSRCSPKRIWEHLSEGGSVDQLTVGLWSSPADWIRMHAGRLQDRFLEIRTRAREYYNDACLANTTGDRIERKDFALWVHRHVPEYAPMLFAYFDDKDQEVIDQMIWKKLKPRGDEVFRPESEDL